MNEKFPLTITMLFSIAALLSEDTDMKAILLIVASIFFFFGIVAIVMNRRNVKQEP